MRPAPPWGTSKNEGGPQLSALILVSRPLADSDRMR
jgi:hypothetical protein